MNRRDFVKGAAGAAAGLMLGGSGALMAQTRRQITIGGRRVKTVDVHAHVTIPEATEMLRGTPLGRAGGGGGGGGAVGGQVMGPERLRTMDGYGIDVQALSINPFWYGADRALSAKLMDLQNDKLAEICEQYVKKGTKVYIEGRIQTRDWEGEDGVKRYRTEIVIDNMIMLDKKGSISSDAAESSFQPPREQRAVKKSSDETSEQVKEEEVSIDDLPF